MNSSSFDSQASGLSNAYETQLANIERAQQAAKALQQQKDDAVSQTTDRKTRK